MKRILLISTLALMASCQSNNTKSVAAIDRNNFDESVAINEDFYQYTTGGWQKNNPLKPEFSRYGSFDILRENNEIRLNDLFAAMSDMDTKTGTVEQKISDLYTMGLDSVRLNEQGAAPIKAMVEHINGIESREELLALIAQMHKSVANPFFGVYVGADLMDSNANTLYISQGGLGMGNRDYYLEERNAEIKSAYATFLEQIFTLAGIENGAKGAKAVIAIEDVLAEASRSNVELRDVAAGYNPFTHTAFENKFNNFDWKNYFAGVGIADFETIIVEQPEFIEAMVKLFNTSSIEDLKYYVASHYISSASSYLSDDFYAASFEMFGRVMSGTEQPRPRWKRAMAVPNGSLGEAVGEMYVDTYFPEEDKVRMVAMVEDLRVALGQHVDKLTWMSDETKAKAHRKLDTFTVKVGYPDTWKDYSSLEVDPAKSYWENIVAVNTWHTADNFSELGKAVDREKWMMSPQTVNAYYNPTTNEICFPAAILQPPFYNPTADDAVNYGAIGVVIGHEMTHGFDDQGRQFDELGNMNNWWTEADSKAFAERTQGLVDQFNAINVLPDMKANGALSLGENIADQGGLRVAYTALHNRFAGNTPEPKDGFTAEQRFYIAYSTLWAQNIREAEIARLTREDVHSLGRLRVNATLRNIDEFFAAFNITDGEMFRPAAERVVIW